MPTTPAPDTHIKVVMVVKVYKDIVIVGVLRRDVPGRGYGTPAHNALGVGQTLINVDAVALHPSSDERIQHG
jgi:hypothetical protein